MGRADSEVETQATEYMDRLLSSVGLRAGSVDDEIARADSSCCRFDANGDGSISLSEMHKPAKK